MIFFRTIKSPGFYLSLLATVFIILPIYVNAQEIVTGESASSYYEAVSDEFRKQIEMAIPPEAYVTPIKPRKLLVLNLHVNNAGLSKRNS